LRQCLDAALALRKLLQQLEPMRMPERFRYSRELREQDLLRALLRCLPRTALQTFLRTLA
jgi:hypothetical protein